MSDGGWKDMVRRLTQERDEARDAIEALQARVAELRGALEACESRLRVVDEDLPEVHFARKALGGGDGSSTE